MVGPAARRRRCVRTVLALVLLALCTGAEDGCVCDAHEVDSLDSSLGEHSRTCDICVDVQRACTAATLRRPHARACAAPPPCAADGDAFMPVEYQRTVPGNPQYDPNAPKQHFWPSFFFVRSAIAGMMVVVIGTWRRIRGGDSRLPHPATAPVIPHPCPQLNAEMLRANSRIDQRHQWDSVWCVRRRQCR